TNTLLSAPLFPYTTLFRSEQDDEGLYGQLPARRRERILCRLLYIRLQHGDHGPGPEEEYRVGKSQSCDRLGICGGAPYPVPQCEDRKSTRLNSSHVKISYA